MKPQIGDKIYNKMSKTIWEVTATSYDNKPPFITAKSITSGQLREIENLLSYGIFKGEAESYKPADVGKAFTKAYETRNGILTTMTSVSDLVDWYRVTHEKNTTTAYTPEQLYAKVKECHKFKIYTVQAIADKCFIHKRTLQKYCVDMKYIDSAQLIFEKQFKRKRV